MTRPFLLREDETRKEMASLGGPMRCLVSAVDSAGSMSILEQRLDEPGGPPLHTHLAADEWFIVIEGGPLSVQVGDQRYEVRAGQSVFIPRGTPHAFNNLSGRPLRGLSVTTPGGIETQLDAQARYVLGLRGTPPDPSKVAEIWGEQDRVVGPPLR